jgi:type VI secretion system secreted protein VgrG
MSLDTDLSKLVLGGFDTRTRLHRLEGDGPLRELLLQTWCSKESLNEAGEIHLTALSENARLNLREMLSRPVTVHTLLSDGREFSRSGIVTSAVSKGADGGLALYALVVRPWIALLQYTRRSQVWQDKPVTEIVDSVFGAYAQHAAWRWADCIAGHLESSANSGVRSYTVQYRETDYAFVQRLLAEEGIVYRFERNEAAPLGHRLVLLADTVSTASCPEDPSSQSALSGQGIRFHGASPLEEQDTIQALLPRRRMASARVTLLSGDYKGKRSIAASMPTVADFAGANAPRLESYDHAGAYAFADVAQAERAARLAQEALEARHKTWTALGTVRTFSAGTQFDVTQSTLDALAAFGEEPDRRFLITSVIHAGINNLPLQLLDRSHTPASAQEQQRRLLKRLQPWVPQAVAERAGLTGYANTAELIRAAVPWRALLNDETGARLNPKPLVGGPLLATVGGPKGETRAEAGQEIHTDRLGRIRIQYEFQQGVQAQGTSASSTWVRVMQRYAGRGMGLQFIPRIGQQVLVDFNEGDIDRPMVVASMYTGRGEGGAARTPGGKPGTADTGVFSQSIDHAPSGQGNLAGGNSPAWHGASADADGQNNLSALSGFKSKEFGWQGFNQLVFDDSNQQQRVQLGSTQYSTQLNMGHLIHQADNHRGSFRGLGFELRTDAYGVIRGGRGVLLSTFGTQANEPAGDNAAGIALALQAFKLAEVFSSAAKTHEAVQMAAHIGSFKPWQSILDSAGAPLKALHTALRGMVDAGTPDAAINDAESKNTATADGKTPHTTDPVLAIAAKAGLATVAGQDLQMAAGETITLGSGEDTQWAIGGAARIHTGQAIGMLAGAIKPGTEAAGKGITLIAGRGDIEMQAQSDAMQIAAKGNVTIQSANSHIDWAAAKRIVMSTAGGANITIEDGNITVQCPGKITIKASKKSFVPGEKADFVMPVMPHADNSWLKVESYFDGWEVPRPRQGINLAVGGKTIAESLSVELEQKEQA